MNQPKFSFGRFVFLILTTAGVVAQGHTENSTIIFGSTSSKNMGEISVRMNLKDLTFAHPKTARPETHPSIGYDSGQIVQMTCETRATFTAVAEIQIEATATEDHQFGFVSGFLDATISNGYEMSSPDELCHPSDLTEVKNASLTGEIFSSRIPILLQGQEVSLELNFHELTYDNEISVSGDENLMSFDGINLKKIKRNGLKVYYQIVKRDKGSVSTFEAGWLTLK